MFREAVYVAPVLALLLMVSCGTRTDPLAAFPRVVLWAWERPEHLLYIDPHTTGVAFLARTITWGGGELTWRPRYQPLDLAPGTVVMAVVRMEALPGPLPDAETVATRIAEVAQQPGVQALQVDFDTRQSEREWYTSVLQRVRQRLRPPVTLNITALASWCLGDPWIRNLPVNDAVPMLFRMGAGEPKQITDFSAPVCRQSVGISTDEALLAVPHGRRLFIFHPRAWTPEAYRGAMGIAARLR